MVRAPERMSAVPRRDGDRRPRPVMLAIAGDSAAGKTTLARGIEAVLGEDRVTRLCVDDYHKYDRKARAELGITPLHPACNYIDIMEQHLGLLGQGEPILKPVYDHSTGTFTAPVYIEPREYVVIEGLLPLYTRGMRECFHVKTYLAPEEGLRRQWKINRDTAKRGYEAEQVIQEMVRREPDAVAFIRPQRSHADIVVKFHRTKENGDNGLGCRLTLRPTLQHPDLEALVALVSFDDYRPIRLLLDRDRGKPVDVLEIGADVPPPMAKTIEDIIWRRMDPDGNVQRDRIGLYLQGDEWRRSETLALAQLLIVYQLLGPARKES